MAAPFRGKPGNLHDQRKGFALAEARLFRAVLALVSLIAVGAAASAHTGSATGGFGGGFTHPLFGADHVVAMVAVGLWGAFLGAPAIWLLPILFPLIMAAG